MTRRFTPTGSSLAFAACAGRLMVELSFQHSLERLTQPAGRNDKPTAPRIVFEGEEE
jgi:hypothetical protein